MIIECEGCESKVDATVLCKKEYPADENNDPFKYEFLECPVCKSVMVGFSDIVQTGFDEWGYGSVTRVWPVPKDAFRVHRSIPHLVGKSLEEARKCLNAKAFSACAVMAGRAIEAICSEHKTKSKNLAGGLKELRDKKIIDGRLFEWSEALRTLRNIGAHATEEDVSREDATDTLDFAVAICEYVFVLTEKYAAFLARAKKKPKPSAGTST